MRRILLLLPLLSLLAAPAASAAGLAPMSPSPVAPSPPVPGMPPPVVPPAPGVPISPPPPVTGSDASGPSLVVTVVAAYPANFDFNEYLLGTGFHPGERVTVTAANVSAGPISLTAGSDGSFHTVLSFHWVFCGPGGQRTAAPVFTASGDRGSKAAARQFSPPCPYLSPVQPLRYLPGASSAGGSGGVLHPIDPSRLPKPSTRPVTLHGFGFVPGEIVTLRAVSALYPALAPVAARADSMGRVGATLSVYLPSPCAYPRQPSLVQAEGDRGTAVLAPVPIVSTVLCRQAPGGGVPPATAPVAVAAGAPVIPTLSVRLQHGIIRPGKTERAAVSTTAGSHLTLAIRYAGGHSQHLTASTGAAGHRTVHWRVPRSTHHGPATVMVLTTQGSVSATFQVR